MISIKEYNSFRKLKVVDHHHYYLQTFSTKILSHPNRPKKISISKSCTQFQKLNQIAQIDAFFSKNKHLQLNFQEYNLIQKSKENKLTKNICYKGITHQFQIQKTISQGQFASVYLALHLSSLKEDKQNGKKCAIKIIKRQIQGYSQIQKKYILQLMQRQLKITNLIKNKIFLCNNQFIQSNSTQSIIVNNYLQGFSLRDLIQSKIRFTKKQLQYYIASLLSAIQECHQNGFMHRDIKPQNIMILKTGQLKLIDFGCAKIANKKQRSKSIVGTCQYFSPEMIKQQYGYQCDIWSLGVVCHQILTGSLPFNLDQCNDEMQKMMKLKSIYKKKKRVNIRQKIEKSKQNYNGNFEEYINECSQFINLSEGILNGNYEQRINKWNAQQIKKSKIFQGFDWDILSTKDNQKREFKVFNI